ncbi:MAG: WbqC family protein [Nitrosomonadales bacterium]|nr:WbqC family protein [Nitrosomonadales bacterium]
MKSLAIMQPYFLPYPGYFQLIAAVDTFVVYDNIKYTKKGWINRNRMLRNGRDAMFSLPLKSDSDSLDVCERELAADFNRDKLLNQFREAYRRAPCFEQTFPLLEQIVRFEDPNLFRFLHHSITRICEHLGIPTRILVSSGIAIDHGLKNQDKVLALCEAMGAGTYVNAIGGVELYSKEAFRDKGIDLKFIKSGRFEYPQFGGAFVPALSIVDAMMFNAPDALRHQVAANYELV